MSVFLSINNTLSPLPPPPQIDSTQLICCREQVARSLSRHQASLPPNTVFIYQPLRQSLEPCGRGVQSRWAPSAAPPPLAQAQAPAPARVPHPSPTSASTPTLALLSPPNLRLRPTVRLRCKPSAKRKVEQMEVDEFFDGIKRLYNEEAAEGAVGGEAAARGCSSLLVPRQEGSSSPCPPLQPVSVP